MNLSKQDFDYIREYIKKNCGIALKDDKKYLIHQRLEPLLKSYQINSFSELTVQLMKNASTKLREDIILAMTTNETSFFRDRHPFDTFEKLVLEKFKKKFKEQKGKKFRIWSAGASTGQEPYTIAMLIYEFVEKNKQYGFSLDNFVIAASDISTRALNKAKSATYYDAEINRGLSLDRKLKYFKKEDKHWQLEQHIRNMVTFYQLNFMDSLSRMGSFDMIFCRNVLIYFDQNTKKMILQQFHRMLVESGFFILGAMENAHNESDMFSPIRFGSTLLYQKKSLPPKPSFLNPNR
ncbi:MAG: protein-glutamate O-methyltransferase CheR [Candidatus Magnetomorum sp.]|nr:protein-glutamate O-methyltransferase CheR [Candidatus Magnetomorum sp.]